jgi:hypothetical protein
VNTLHKGDDDDDNNNNNGLEVTFFCRDSLLLFPLLCHVIHFYFTI